MGEPLEAFIDGNCSVEDELHHRYWSSWYFSKEEIEKNTPSRKDGIDLRKESQLRMSYCSFLRDLGIRLGLYALSLTTLLVFHMLHMVTYGYMFGSVFVYFSPFHSLSVFTWILSYRA